MSKTLYVRLSWWRVRRFLPGQWVQCHIDPTSGALIVAHSADTLSAYADGRWRNYWTRAAGTRAAGSYSGPLP